MYDIINLMESRQTTTELH